MDHSRDRLQENNIVNEIESSFIEYSMRSYRISIKFI